jgi:hypothetical protein
MANNRFVLASRFQKMQTYIGDKMHLKEVISKNNISNFCDFLFLKSTPHYWDFSCHSFNIYTVCIFVFKKMHPSPSRHMAVLGVGD